MPPCGPRIIVRPVLVASVAAPLQALLMGSPPRVRPADCLSPPGTETAVGGGLPAEAGYALPHPPPRGPHPPADGGWPRAARRRVAGRRDSPGRGRRPAPQGGCSAALPLCLGDLDRGLLRRPGIVDLVVAYEFSESTLQPQERDALPAALSATAAALRSSSPHALIPGVRRSVGAGLFGITGEGVKEAPGLRLGRQLLVPADYTIPFDAELPVAGVAAVRAVGIVLADGLEPVRSTLERPERWPVRSSSGTAALFSRASSITSDGPAAWCGSARLSRHAFRLFPAAAWSCASRRRLALLAAGYAAAAVGLLLSFGSLLIRLRRPAGSAGAVVIAAGVAAVLYASTAADTGFLRHRLHPDLSLKTGPVADDCRRVAARPRRGHRTVPRPDAAPLAPLQPPLRQPEGLASLPLSARGGGRCTAAPRRRPEPVRRVGPDRLATRRRRPRRSPRLPPHRPTPKPSLRSSTSDGPPGRPACAAASDGRTRTPIRLLPPATTPSPRPAAPLSCSSPFSPAAAAQRPAALGPPKPGTVRVAAVQCYSRMGRLDDNRKLAALVTQARRRGCQDRRVLPECAAPTATWTRSRPRLADQDFPAEDGPAV